jgi:hypothetical protein
MAVAGLSGGGRISGGGLCPELAAFKLRQVNGGDRGIFVSTLPQSTPISRAFSTFFSVL